MRRDLALSVAAHAVGFAIWRAASSTTIGTATVTARPAPAPLPEAAAVRAVVPESIDVEFVQLPPAVSSAVPPARETEARGRRDRAIEASRDRTDTGTGTEPVTTTGSDPARPGMLAMRGEPKRRGLVLPDLGAIAAGGEPLTRPAPVSGRVIPNGTRIDDAVTTIDVAPDGTVDFHDTPLVTATWLNPLLSPNGLRDPGKALEKIGKAVGVLVEDWARDPYARTYEPPRAEQPQLADAVDPTLGHGGGAGVDVDTGGAGATVPLLGGNLDLGGWAERLAGNDPYNARKRKLLDATFAERADRGAAHRADQRDRVVELVRKNLAQLWRATTDPAARRAALFQMWDECDESEGPEGEAGARARAQIVGWIRSHLPAATADAYTAEELARLDAARHSHQPFRPYE